MDFLHDDFADEAFHTALVSLKTAICNQGLDGVKVIADYAGKKKSTVYAWLSGQDVTGEYTTPSGWHDVWRIAHGSTSDGYTEFVDAMTAATMHLEGVGETSVNGVLTDEKRRSDIVWGSIFQAKDAGNAAAIERLGKDLKTIGNAVIAEGRAEQ